MSSETRIVSDVVVTSEHEEIPGLEAIVADAERLGFEMSSSAELGPLLRVLAASKPGGRLLELGTGAGVGTAWLLAGMDEDAHLTSVENDPRVLEIAQRHLAGDGRVAFRLEDGERFLDGATDESFDLVFADTWPGKFYELDGALSLVAVGGIYIVDDLSPRPDWPGDHAEKVESLVAELRSRPGFVSMEMAWSSGLMMLVRVSEAV